MPYQLKKKVYNASINTVELGAGDKAVKIGGNNTLPFYSFDAPAENKQKIGVEISDLALETYTQKGLADFYAGCDSIEAMAVKAQELPGVSMIVLHFEGADPNGRNRSVEECVATAKAVAEKVTMPIVVMGCKNVEKDAELFAKISEALAGKNILVLSARQENYKTVGASAALAYNQKVGAESADDINLAKQLNTVMTQLGIPAGSIVMQPGCAAAGYGFEYVISTLDRIKAAALGASDTQLQMPIITPISTETWGVKESTLPESEDPEWGDAEERGIQMEITTAAACLASGSDAVIMRHPAAIAAISQMIDELA